MPGTLHGNSCSIIIARFLFHENKKNNFQILENKISDSSSGP